MKKLFLWTFVLTLLCTWVIAGADQTPTVSSMAPAVDRDAIKAEKDKAVQEVLSGKASLSNVAPAGLAVPAEAEAEIQQAEPALVQARGLALPEKAPSTGPANVPDQNVILQGGDTCDDAFPIPSLPFTADGTTAGYTNDYDEVCFFTGSTAPDVVYSYTPEADLCVDISLCLGTTNYDTKLYIYEDVCPDPGNYYACNDDYCDAPFDYDSELHDVFLYVGHTYYIVVDGYGTDYGLYTIDIVEVECPTEPEPGCPIEQPDNAANGIFADPDCDICGGGGQWVADQVVFNAGNVPLYGITFWGGYYPSDVSMDPDHFTFMFHADDGAGQPGAVLYTVADVAAATKAQTGDILFGTHEYEYTFDLTPYSIVLGPGVFHIQIYNNTLNSPSPGDDWYWETGDMDPFDGVLGQNWGTTGDTGPWNYDPTYDMSWILDCGTGEPVYGACCDESTGECVDNVAYEDCLPPLRFGAYTLCADLDPPCEVVECADYTVNAPVENATGTTCGAGNDCDLETSEEIIYEVIIPNDGEWTFSLCGSDFDTRLYVGTTCCGQEVGFNDDYCDLQSQLTAVITAGTYYAAIEGYSNACGNYVFNVWEEEECVVECPPGGLDEGEPCDQDTNGGCNTDPANPPTTDISCDDTYCGLGWYDGATRDTDWYLLDELTGPTEVTVTLMAEFDALFGIIVPNSQDICDNDGVVTYYDLPLACEEGFVQATLPGDRPYVVFVAPLFTELVTCADYWVTVECEPLGPCENIVTVEILTDDYPTETTWDLVYVATGEVVGSGGPYSDPQTMYTAEACIDVDPTGCYLFTIYDSFGDGISLPPGFYSVYDPAFVLVCSGGGDFGYEESCYFGTCEPAACCIGSTCEDLTPQECADAGGTWYYGEDCATFDCPLTCADAVWHNGDPNFVSIYASQCATDYPFQGQAADDVIFEEDTDIVAVVSWLDGWNNYGDPFDSPADFEGIQFVIYPDVGGVPGGYPLDQADCSNTGDIVYEEIILPGDFSYMVDGSGWKVWFDLGSTVPLQAGTTYWVVVEPIFSFSVFGQGGPITTEVVGSLPLLYFPAAGQVEWGTPATWTYGLAFCLLGEAVGPPLCDYVPGDCNHNDVALELADVIAMIGMYRGTVTPAYTCDCPPWGTTFAPEADPNGNCIALELADVVAEIAAYRGTGTAYGCVDCPGDGPPPPLLGKEGTSVIPSLKSKVKTTQQGSAD